MEDTTMENANNELDFSEFLEADNEDGGYQTAESDIIETTEAAEEAAEEPTGGENAEENTESGSEGSNDQSQAEGVTQQVHNETFTIKVNKEERTVSRDEMISLAQQGADYARVKGQLEESRNTVADLRKQIDQVQEMVETIDMLAQQNGTSAEDLLEQMYVSMQRQKGVSEDAARATYQRDKVQRQLSKMEEASQKAANSQKSMEERAMAEIAEFRDQYPDVELNEDLFNALKDDVKGGMSVVNAYRKMESAKQSERIAELEAELAAEKQNKANRASSPGSQRDAGGQTKRNQFDDFMDAFK